MHYVVVIFMKKNVGLLLYPLYIKIELTKTSEKKLHFYKTFLLTFSFKKCKNRITQNMFASLVFSGVSIAVEGFTLNPISFFLDLKTILLSDFYYPLNLSFIFIFSP